MQYRPKDYRHIMAWGKLLGSYQYYIKDQQEQAALENAPLDAVYKHSSGKGWVTFEDLHPAGQQRVQEYLK